MKTRKFYSYGHELDNVGELRESQVSEGFDVLRQRADEDGYLFISSYQRLQTTAIKSRSYCTLEDYLTSTRTFMERR